MSEICQKSCGVGTLPFFRDLNPILIKEIEGQATLRRFSGREVVYLPGDSSNSVYWLQSGRVKLSRVSGDGRELTFKHFYAGDMFGEDCMFSGAHRSNCAQALEPTVLICLDGRDFRALLSQEVELALAVAHANFQRLREAEYALSETVFRPVRERIAAGLLRLYNKGGRQSATIRVTHQEMANLVGSTRETTTSVLHGLREAGLLETANRRVTVLDSEGLARFAEAS
jgi:CRP/FNR family transcriptional regulator, cyclic AMP receptor protein